MLGMQGNCRAALMNSAGRKKVGHPQLNAFRKHKQSPGVSYLQQSTCRQAGGCTSAVAASREPSCSA